MTQDSIRLLLRDDHGLWRSSLSRFLSAYPGLEVAGECGTIAQAQEILEPAEASTAQRQALPHRAQQVQSENDAFFAMTEAAPSLVTSDGKFT